MSYALTNMFAMRYYRF